MRRILLLVPLAAGLLHCGNSAVKPKPGATAGTNAGNGSNSTAGSSGGTRGASTGSASTTTAGSTAAATTGSTGTTSTAGSTGTPTSAGSTASTSAAGSTGSTGNTAGSTGSTGAAAGSTGSTGAATTGGSTGSTGGSTGSTDGFIRLASLVPTRGTFDFCLTPSGGAPIGPIINGYGVGGTNGLTFGDVSLYLPVPGSAAGIAYAITVVAAGATSCTPPLLAPLGATVTSVTGEYRTVVATGLVASAAAPLTYTEYVDRVAGSATETLVRFFHASPDPTHATVDFGKVGGGGNVNNAFFTGVTYGGSSVGQGSAGPRGYHALLPVTNQDFGVVDAGTSRPVLATTANPLNLAAGTASSFFFIGDPNAGNFPLQLLYCPDDGALAVSGSAVLASCQ